MRYYRALISVPIQARTDEEALDSGAHYANALTHPGGSVVAGHLELVGEVREDLLEISRVVRVDPLFLQQLPSDWKLGVVRKVLYCRRCDLGFCERHQQAHRDLEARLSHEQHDLEPDDRVTFCAVCAGIYECV